MSGRKIGEIGSSARGMYIRNIADITPDWSDICSTADIPELYEIPNPALKQEQTKRKEVKETWDF